MSFLSGRSRLATAFIIVLHMPLAWAQRSGGVDPSRAGGPVDLPNAGSPVLERSSTGHPIFVSGKVVVQGGGGASHILIERICNGMVRREGYTDAKGGFQFELGRNSMERDASQGDSDRMVTNRSARMTSSGASQVKVDECDLRGSLPGFVSTTVPMHVEAYMSLVDVGTIVLTRMGRVEGSTISVTSMAVPKDAQQAFEKGRKAGSEKKYDDAARELNKAIRIYPHFAAAWSMLGEIHRLQNQFEPAKKEYAEAMASDPKFVSPYFGLAAMAVVEGKWEEAARLTDQLIQLNALAYPLAYFFNAAANYNLGNVDAAEKSARKFQQMDTAHTRPDIALLLANILISKHQYAEAAQLYRDYLAARPDAPNAAMIETEAKRLEALSTAKQQ
jgi:Tfp pilus assembly protein PilF